MLKGLAADILAAVVIVGVSWSVGTALMWAVDCHQAHVAPMIEGKFTLFPDNPDWSRLKGGN